MCVFQQVSHRTLGAFLGRRPSMACLHSSRVGFQSLPSKNDSFHRSGFTCMSIGLSSRNVPHSSRYDDIICWELQLCFLFIYFMVWFRKGPHSVVKLINATIVSLPLLTMMQQTWITRVFHYLR